jgi:hypothetical protein
VVAVPPPCVHALKSDIITHQPQFWPAYRLHMVAAAWEAIFTLINPNFRFLCPSPAFVMSQFLENKGFACPKNVQKNLKKLLTPP